MDWIETTPGQAWMKILWTGSETRTWAVISSRARAMRPRRNKHLAPAPHLHQGQSCAVLSTRWRLHEPDYDYEPNGVLHGATTALEDTEYLFICNGGGTVLRRRRVDELLCRGRNWSACAAARRRWAGLA